MTRPSVISCSVFGGRSPKTGRLVGERHRWGGGAWGVGRCDFCGRYLDEVLEKPKVGLTLTHAIRLDEAKAREVEWHPSYWDGSYGFTAGWFIQRHSNGLDREWLKDAGGSLLRFDSKAEALKAIADHAVALGQVPG